MWRCSNWQKAASLEKLIRNEIGKEFKIEEARTNENTIEVFFENR